MYYCIWFLMKLPYLSNSAAYFSEMMALFDLIEREYEIDVVIAAHPCAEYIGNEFGCRKILHNMSHSLVRDCDFVISHHSNSIAYAVMYHKPVLFCFTNEMKKIYKTSLLHHQNCYAQYLGLPTFCVNYLLKFGLPDIMNLIEIKPYKEFVSDFLTCKKSINQVSGDIIIDVIDNL